MEAPGLPPLGKQARAALRRTVRFGALYSAAAAADAVAKALLRAP